MNNDKTHENECSFCHNISRPTLDIGGGGIEQRLICGRCVIRALEGGEAVKKGIEWRLYEAIPNFQPSAGHDAIDEVIGLLTVAWAQRDQYGKEMLHFKSKLLASEAAEAEMRSALEKINNEGRWSADVTTGLLSPEKDGPWCLVDHKHIARALSTDCGKPLLDELKRKTEALESLLVPIPIDKTRTDEFYKGQVNALLMVQEVARAALQPK